MCRPRTPVFVSPMKQIQQPSTKKAVMRMSKSSQPKRRTMKARAYNRMLTMISEKKQKKPVAPSIVDDMSSSRYSLLCVETSRDRKKPCSLSMMLGDDCSEHQRRGLYRVCLPDESVDTVVKVKECYKDLEGF